MKSLHKIEWYNEGALFDGFSDQQIQTGRRLRKMYKALTFGLKMNKNDAIDKIVYDMENKTLWGFDEYINEKFIRTVLNE